MEPSNAFPLDIRVRPAKVILRFIGISYLGIWAWPKEGRGRKEGDPGSQLVKRRGEGQRDPGRLLSLCVTGAELGSGAAVGLQ